MRRLSLPLLFLGVILGSRLLAQSDSAAGAVAPASAPPVIAAPAAASATNDAARPTTAQAQAAPQSTQPVAAPASAATPVAGPPASPSAAPAVAASAPVTASTPAAPVVAVRTIDPSIELAARLTVLEQFLVAQREREMSLYRETNRLISMLGIGFAVIGMIGLVAAAFFNYRGLMAVQAGAGRAPAPRGSLASSFLPASVSVPGMERVEASGNRFQSQMSSLEQRLAELEHVAGREPAPALSALSARESDSTAFLAPQDGAAAPPPRPTIPRAAILVQKAQTLLHLGKLDEALATLDKAAADGGSNSDVHFTRAQALERMGRVGDALLAYDQAVTSDESNTNALLMKAGLLNRQERFAEALACYERALEVHRAHG